MTARDKRWEQLATAFAPQLITVAEYQRWEIRRYLAIEDPQYLKELEDAA